MRKTFLFFATLTHLCAHELIYISNDAGLKSLQELYKTYTQPLIVNDTKVYLIPSDCRLERYFGGASQSPVKLSEQPYQTQKIIITQEVFEAKDEAAIEKKIEADKSVALIEGKVSKAFLDDKEGRGYGGASQVPLDFRFQQIAAVQVHMKPEKTKSAEPADAKPVQHPHCRLLDDGSGYQLEHIGNASLYSQEGLTPLSGTAVLFK